MSIKFSTRPVVPLDYKEWFPLWEAYNAFYGRAGATALEPEITQMTWSRYCDRAKLLFTGSIYLRDSSWKRNSQGVD